MNTTVEKIRKEIVPSKQIQSKMKEVSELVMDLVQKETVKNPNITGVEIGGSYAKGTWLAKKADVDIFVKFKENIADKAFRDSGKKVGFDSLKNYKPYIRYSEHPYVEAIVKNTKVNVVPCYDVQKGNWKSAADRSQFHTRFMQKNLDNTKQDQVRILKQFLKSNKLYGAEISKQGFSGYISEVLIWNLGNFDKVLEKFAKIQIGDIIGKTSKTFDTPIIITDPIDDNRNLAAAISNENICKMVLISRAFLRKPSKTFFESKKYKASKDATKQVMLLKFAYKGRSPDIIWGQIKKASTSLATQMSVSGFKVIKNSAISDEKNQAIIIFLLESLDISEKQVKEGPEVFNEKDSSSFIAKNHARSELMWVNDSKKILTLERREFSNAKKFLNNLLTAKIERSGIPKGLKEDIKKGFSISVGISGIRKSIKEELLEFVSTDEKIFSAYK